MMSIADTMEAKNNQAAQSGNLSDPKDIPYPLALLPEQWLKILDKELEALDKNRPMELTLLQKEITDQEKYVKQWSVSLTMEEIEQNYSQSEIDEAEQALDTLETSLKGDKETKRATLQIVQDNVDKQEDKVKVAEQNILGLLRTSKDLPGLITAAKAEMDRLEQAKIQASGPEQEKLIQPDLTAAKDRWERLSKADYKADIDKAIIEALGTWQEARKALKNLIVNSDGQEELNIQINKIEKKLAYLKTHRTALIKKYLETQAGSAQAKQA